jgi:hypothetical protein
MKKLAKVIFLMVLCSIFFNSLPVKAEEDQVALSAGLLAVLSQKGLMQICPGDGVVFALVEPMYWKAQTHVRKQKIVQAMINVARTEKNRPKFAIFQDMTSRENVAKGFVDSGKIEIYK